MAFKFVSELSPAEKELQYFDRANKAANALILL